MKTLKELKERLATLEREIDEYPSWGAWLTVADEERRGLKAQIERMDKKK